MTYYTKPGGVTVWATTQHGEMEVARVGPATRPMTLRRADARLFAAAPDLLVALQDMVQQFEKLLIETRLTKRDADAMRELLPHWTADARAAINKALEGQQ